MSIRWRIEPVKQFVLRAVKDQQEAEQRKGQKSQGAEFREPVVRSGPLGTDQTGNSAKHDTRLTHAEQYQPGNRKQA